MSGILNQSELNDYFPPTPHAPHKENMRTVTEVSKDGNYYLDT